jgi:hypothetical protein
MRTPRAEIELMKMEARDACARICGKSRSASPFFKLSEEFLFRRVVKARLQASAAK